MANIKDLKKRIRSTKGTHKITSAMKLVSAAKLAKAQGRIQGAKPYADELENTIKTISALVQNYHHDFLAEKKENNRVALLVISSDKGLCGGFNSNIVKKVRNFITENKDLDIKVYFVGKKAKENLAKEVNVGKHFTFEKIDPSFDEIRRVVDELGALFSTGEVGKVMVAYNEFFSAINVQPKITTVLPMVLPESEKQELEKNFPFDFKYDPAPSEILDRLIPQVFVTSVYTKVLESIAGEHGSRMNAMENASKNCNELIRSLTLKMNKLRQAAITTELIEVVSGAESLNG